MSGNREKDKIAFFRKKVDELEELAKDIKVMEHTGYLDEGLMDAAHSFWLLRQITSDIENNKWRERD